jgi:hypothetical protein
VGREGDFPMTALSPVGTNDIRDDYPNENPVDFLLRQFGITRSAFTKAHGFGENHLLLVAQGRKEGVGDMLESALFKEAETSGVNVYAALENKYGFSDLDEAWFFWRLNQRHRTSLPEMRPGVGSPMSRLVRTVGSIAKTAKVLRVRDIMVKKYMHQAEMPRPIADAFREIEGDEFVEQFDRAQQRYFKDRGRKR